MEKKDKQEKKADESKTCFFLVFMSNGQLLYFIFVKRKTIKINEKRASKK